MKALIKKYPGETDLEIVDIPRPVCPDDGVVLKIRTAAFVAVTSITTNGPRKCRSRS